MKRSIALSLISFLLLSQGALAASGAGSPSSTPLPPPPPAATPTLPVDNSPEGICFTELDNAIKGSPDFAAAFPNGLQEVKKVNAGLHSEGFPLKTYRDFLNISGKPIPINYSEITKFPNNFDRVRGGMTQAGRVYKGNRTHIGSIMYQDSTETSVGDIDGDGIDETIKGYYLDTRVATFGQNTNFKYPTRSRNPKSTRQYPFGSPYDDFREYMVYTHHLAPQFGGKFLSCGIVKTVPDGNYNLNDITGDNYGGNVFFGSSYKTNVITANGMRFRKGEVRIQTVDKVSLYKNPFLHFNVITLAYDNGSNFLNEYTTLEIQKSSMVDPVIQETGLLETVQKFYHRLKTETNLGVANGVSNYTTAGLNLKNIQASTLDAPENKGGLGIYEGFSFNNYEEIGKIKDEGLRDYLKWMISPGREEAFKEGKEGIFQERKKVCNLSEDTVSQNIGKILNDAQGAENVDPRDLEFTHLEFGQCIYPYIDQRERSIRNGNPFDGKVSEKMLKQKQEQMRKLEEKLQTIRQSGQPSFQELEKIAKQQKKIEEGYQEKINSYMEIQGKLEKTYNSCGIDILQMELQNERGEITLLELQEKSRAKKQECKEQFNTLSEKYPTIKDQLPTISNLKPWEKYQKRAQKKAPKTSSPKESDPIGKLEKSYDLYRYFHWIIVGGATFLGLVLLYYSLRYFRRR